MSAAKESHHSSKQAQPMGHMRTSMSSPVFICAVAFLVRIIALAMLQGSEPGRLSHIWESGPEIVNIATEISHHGGFSSPFAIESGPTAWIPPVYPSLLGAIFIALGTRSNLAAATILAIQSLLSALTCIPLYAIAKRTFADRGAVWSAWAWALFPYEVVLPGLFVWETFLSGFLAVLLCHISMSARRESWMPVGEGALWGIAGLTNTALLSLMPVFLLARSCQRQVPFARKKISLVIFFTILTVCPWILRNWLVFRSIIPIRSNFGEELWKGNHDGGTGRIEFGVGPADNEVQRERYRGLGEIAYVRQRRMEAMQFIRREPGRYVRLVLYRLQYWWWAQGEHAPVFFFYRLLSLLSLGGIALAIGRLKNPGVVHLLGAVLVYPVVYYLTDVFARYRYPIEPFLMIFAGFALSQGLEFVRARSRQV